MRKHNRQARWPMPPGAIVVGGQWGSEGKGAVIYEIGHDYPMHVRVGGPQAGHSIKLATGRVLKLQTIPVGVALGKWGVIAMQSVLDPEVLERELGWFEELGLPLELAVDPRATVLVPEYREGEELLTARLGSTGKGVGMARQERIMRRAMTVEEYCNLHQPEWAYWVWPTGTDVLIRQYLDSSEGVLVEAAQGVLLSLFSSGYYPFVTSSEATPVQSFADMGLPLRYAPSFESIGVFRTYPIRVAGNSGPLPREVSWEEVERRRGSPIDEEEKTTTVTRKLRRVAEWDTGLAREVVERCALDWAALTFVDYVHPEVTGVIDYDHFSAQAKRYVTAREKDLGIPIKLVGTGFGTYAWRQP